MNMHTPPPQGAPLAASAHLRAATGPRPPLSAVLDALRVEDEQTRRESARLAEIIGRFAGVSCEIRTPSAALKSEGRKP